jgi:hypothetical protein
LSGAALAHTKEFLNRQAVEVTGFHPAQHFQNFVKPMKPRWLGRHTGIPLLLCVGERSGTMMFFWKVSVTYRVGLIVHDKGRYYA